MSTNVAEPRSGAPLAVFDLDGTLLDGDSTTHWILDLVRRSSARRIAATVIATVAMPLVSVRSLRRAGASMLVWIATAGMDERRLHRSAAIFAERIRSAGSRLRWRHAGLGVLEQHLDAGHRVIVVTAAPRILAEALLSPWRGRVEVLGSTLKPFASGWVGDRYCRSEEKCRCLAEVGCADWDFAYTDSPLLHRARNPVLVNAGDRLVKRVRSSGVTAVRVENW